MNLFKKGVEQVFLNNKASISTIASSTFDKNELLEVKNKRRPFHRGQTILKEIKEKKYKKEFNKNSLNVSKENIFDDSIMKESYSRSSSNVKDTNRNRLFSKKSENNLLSTLDLRDKTTKSTRSVLKHSTLSVPESNTNRLSVIDIKNKNSKRKMSLLIEPANKKSDESLANSKKSVFMNPISEKNIKFNSYLKIIVQNALDLVYIKSLNISKDKIFEELIVQLQIPPYKEISISNEPNKRDKDNYVPSLFSSFQKRKNSTIEKRSSSVKESPTLKKRIVRRRNVKIIANFLKKITGFHQFLNTCGISDTVLKEASEFILHKSFTNNEIIFQKNDKSDAFYGIIKGKVDLIIEYSIREQDNETGEVIYRDYQKIITLKEGCVFGELGLIYGDNRNATVRSNGDSHLFVVKADCFQQFFLKQVLISERNRRIYIRQIFPEMNKMRELRAKDFFKKLIYKFYSRNDIIYSEGSHALKIFLIYNGDCALYKMDLNYFEPTNNVKVYLASKGTICGLEVCKNKDMSNTVTYEQTLICVSPYCTVLEIDKEVLMEISKTLPNRLEKMYNEKKVHIEKTCNDYLFYKEEFRLSYHRSILEKKMNINKELSVDQRSIKMKILEMKINKIVNRAKTPNLLRNFSYDLKEDYLKDDQNIYISSSKKPVFPLRNRNSILNHKNDYTNYKTDFKFNSQITIQNNQINNNYSNSQMQKIEKEVLGCISEFDNDEYKSKNNHKNNQYSNNVQNKNSFSIDKSFHNSGLNFLNQSFNKFSSRKSGLNRISSNEISPFSINNILRRSTLHNQSSNNFIFNKDNFEKDKSVDKSNDKNDHTNEQFYRNLKKVNLFKNNHLAMQKTMQVSHKNASSALLLEGKKKDNSKEDSTREKKRKLSVDCENDNHTKKLNMDHSNSQISNLDLNYSNKDTAKSAQKLKNLANFNAQFKNAKNGNVLVPIQEKNSSKYTVYNPPINNSMNCVEEDNNNFSEETVSDKSDKTNICNKSSSYINVKKKLLKKKSEFKENQNNTDVKFISNKLIKRILLDKILLDNEALNDKANIIINQTDRQSIPNNFKKVSFKNHKYNSLDLDFNSKEDYKNKDNAGNLPSKRDRFHSISLFTPNNSTKISTLNEHSTIITSNKLKNNNTQNHILDQDTYKTMERLNNNTLDFDCELTSNKSIYDDMKNKMNQYKKKDMVKSIILVDNESNKDSEKKLKRRESSTSFIKLNNNKFVFNSTPKKRDKLTYSVRGLTNDRVLVKDLKKKLNNLKDSFDIKLKLDFKSGCFKLPLCISTIDHSQVAKDRKTFDINSEFQDNERFSIIKSLKYNTATKTNKNLFNKAYGLNKK